MKRTNELEHYADYLLQRELAEQTREIYVKQAAAFLDFLENREMTKKESIAYKQMLLKRGQKLSTVNLYLVALNSYLRYAGYGDCTVKTMKRQRRQCPDDILTHAEYRKLLIWAMSRGKYGSYRVIQYFYIRMVSVKQITRTESCMERSVCAVC